MNKKPEDHYDVDFYDNQSSGSLRSAKKILDVINTFYQPTSIIDVGCGQGTWLAAAEKNGISDLCGVDGSWVETNKLMSSKMTFIDCDLSSVSPDVERKFDLAISMEVAEHLPESESERFVEFLCNRADVVLFSAAVPNQGGTNHINEQWQSYWVKLFKKFQFNCYDLVRPEIWNDKDVEWWYRQNALVFIKDDVDLVDADRLVHSKPVMLDVIHPEHFAKKMQYNQQSLIEKIKKKFL